MKRYIPNALIGMLLIASSAFATTGLGAASNSAVPLRANAPDLSAIHDSSSPSFDKNCLKCHADVMKRRTSNAKIKDAHAAMVPFAPGYNAKAGATNEVCVSCHANVDVLQHSAAQIRKEVSVTICAGCHNAAGPSSKKFYAN